MKHVLFRSIFATTAGLSLAAAAVMPAAAAATTTFGFGRAATLVGGGSALRVGIVYKCPATTQFVYGSARVNRAVSGGRVAQGSADFGVDNGVKCDGKAHTLRIFVPVDNGIAFRAGTAFATGSVSACRGNACTNASASRTVSIR
jgi:hypothetical protein